jgi:hypothetical protein
MENHQDGDKKEREKILRNKSRGRYYFKILHAF